MGRFSARPPSNQQPSVIIDRSENARSGDAGPHGDRQVPAVEEHRLSVLQIRRHGAKRRRQLIEIRAVAERQSQLAQGLLEFLPLYESLGEEDVVMLQSEWQAHQEVPVILLASEGQIPARRCIAERLLPVDRAHGGFDVGGGHAARVQSADHGAHAGARDAIDRHFELLEDLEYADVRHTARTASGENQADARPGQARGTGRLGARRPLLCRRGTPELRRTLRRRRRAPGNAPQTACDQRPGQSKSETAIPHDGVLV